MKLAVTGLALLGLLAASAAAAEDWRPLTDAEITKVLERHFLRYPDGSEQFFNYGGLTEYRIGWPNGGRWRVGEDRYCALWPPREGWECYDVALGPDGRQVRFTDALGQVVEAMILEE